MSNASSTATPRSSSAATALKGAARIVSLESRLAKVRTTILPGLHRRVAEHYLSTGEAESLAPAAVVDLKRVDDEMVALEKEEDSRESSSSEVKGLSGRAASTAADLRGRMKRDQLRSRRDTILALVGEECIKRGGSQAEQLGPVLQEIQKSQVEAASLDEEIRKLRRSLPWYAARPRLALGLAAAVLLTGGVGYWYFSRPGPSPMDFAAASMNDMSREVIKQQQELERMSFEENARLEREMQQATTDAQLREIQSQKSELAAREEERRRLEQSKAVTQASLASLAERIYGPYADLPTRVRVATKRLPPDCIRVLGANADKIQAALASKDYLGLTGLLLDRTITQYGSAEDIEMAESNLRRHPFRILVATGSTSTRTPQGEYLALITVREPPTLQNIAYHNPINVSYDWATDPNGRGVYTSWSPGSGRGMVVLMDKERIEQRIKGFNEDLRRDLVAVIRRMDLGELSETLAREEIQRVIATNHIRLVEWFGSQP